MANGFDWAEPLDFLATLGETEQRRVLAGARELTRPAATISEYPAHHDTSDIVLSGLLRAYQVSADGRGATIGYLHQREYLGVLPTLTPRPVVYVQAVVETRLLRLAPDLVRELYETELQVAHAIAIHSASMLARMVRVVTVRTLGTVKERVVFDLLERACAEQLRAGRLVYPATHDDLADSVGASREAVTRILGELRRAGVITTSPRHIGVDDPRRLVDIVHGLAT